MAFILKQSSTYFWPVQIEIPADGGKHEKQTFDAEFKRVTQDRIEEIREAIMSEATNDRAIACEVLIGWTGIKDDAGDDIPFSERNRDDLLNIPGIARTVTSTWMDSLSGAKRKN